jgi:hypothetical protein
MMRRLAAVATLLALSGLLPLSAMAGFCARERCCRPHSATTAMATNPACCGQTTCDTTAQKVQATSGKSTIVPPQIAGTLATSSRIVVGRQSGTSDRIDTGPPPARQRLATLSVLLI